MIVDDIRGAHQSFYLAEMKKLSKKKKKKKKKTIVKNQKKKEEIENKSL